MADKKTYLAGNENNRNRRHKQRGRTRSEWLKEGAISSFFGPELARLELEAMQRPSSHISESIDSIIENVKVDDMAKISKLLEKWDDLVGESIASYARPIAVKNKTLSIEVDNSSAQYTLETYYKDDILKKVQTVCPRDVLSLRFVPAGRRAAKQNPFKK